MMGKIPALGDAFPPKMPADPGLNFSFYRVGTVLLKRVTAHWDKKGPVRSGPLLPGVQPQAFASGHMGPGTSLWDTPMRTHSSAAPPAELSLPSVASVSFVHPMPLIP